MSLNGSTSEFGISDFEAMLSANYQKEDFIASLQEKVARAQKLINIPNLDETLRFHLQRFIDLTQKECHERTMLKGQDSDDYDDTDNYLRNTYISSPGKPENDVYTVLSLIKWREYSEFVPTAVKPFGNVVRIFNYDIMGIISAQ